MRAVIQRVSQSSVSVGGVTIGQINSGLTILLGVLENDTEKDAKFLAEKIANLRIFEDNRGKMNHSLKQVNGAALVISQFTLLADCRKGRRPSFIKAAHPEKAHRLYAHFINLLTDHGIEVQSGRFGAMMKVTIVNEGPVTFVIDSYTDQQA